MAAFIPHPRSLIVPKRGFRKPSQPVLDPRDPINAGLLACWPLGDVGGSGAWVTKDIGPISISGTLVNAPALDSSNYGGMALKFTSAGSKHVATGSVFPVIPKKFSLFCRFKLNATPANEWDFISKASQIRHFGVFKPSSNIVMVGYAGGNTAVIGTTALSTGVWYDGSFVVGDTSASSLALYLNGKLEATASTDAVGTDTVGAAWINGISGLTRYGDVTIDCPRIYTRCLSASENNRLHVEPYAGLLERAPRSRVGVAAAAPSGWGALLSDRRRRLVGSIST